MVQMYRRTATAAVLLVGLAACEPSAADQLMVHVVDGSDGALRIPGDLDAFEVRVATVHGGASDGRQVVRLRRVWRLGSRGFSPPDAVRLPQTLAVVPSDRGTGTVRVDVLGLRSGRAVQRLHRTASFGVGRVDLPPFSLTPLCFGVECPPDQTCEADGECHAAVGRGDGGVPPVDAGPCGAGMLECGGTCVPSDETHCGSCDDACAAGERCVSGTCACGVGSTRCDGECVDLTADPGHCGGCGDACALPGATAACESGSCVIASCDAGRGDCNGMDADGCETTFGSALHCGGCGDRCMFAHAEGRCAGTGTCVLDSCHAGWGDCDGAAGNGCETSLDTLLDCGGCGRRCARAHASQRCDGGSCRIDACHAAWADCNGMDADGCETRIDTATDCGSCAVACPANERCDGTSCYCPGPTWRENAAGECVPSCGHLLNMRDAPRGGTSCCTGGCTTAVVGGPGETWDCDYCCEAPTGTNACP